MNFGRILDIFIALAIFAIILFIFSSIFIDSTIESVKQKLNNLTISCSESPSLNSSQIVFDNNNVIYCSVLEKQKG